MKGSTAIWKCVSPNLKYYSNYIEISILNSSGYSKDTEFSTLNSPGYSENRFKTVMRKRRIYIMTILMYIPSGLRRSKFFFSIFKKVYRPINRESFADLYCKKICFKGWNLSCNFFKKLTILLITKICIIFDDSVLSKT